MVTTIQITETTLFSLKEIKERLGFGSYDAVINALVGKFEKKPKSLFGSNPRLSAFTEEDEAVFDEL